MKDLLGGVWCQEDCLLLQDSVTSFVRTTQREIKVFPVVRGHRVMATDSTKKGWKWLC